MDDFKIDFLIALGEVTEQTGVQLDYDDVADILNTVGITKSDGSSYLGGRGTARFLSCAASQCSDNGNEDGCELIRSITGVDDDDEEDDDDDDYIDDADLDDDEDDNEVEDDDDEY